MGENFRRIGRGLNEAAQEEDDFESKVADLHLDYFVHTAGSYLLTRKFEEYCQSRGINLSDNQLRAIGYPLSLAAGHSKEKFRDETYRPDDVLSYPLGVELYIQHRSYRDEEKDSLTEDVLEPEGDVLDRFEALGKTID